MTSLSFDAKGVDVVHGDLEFRLERSLVEDAFRKEYEDVTDHEVLTLIESDPDPGGEPRRIGDILG